MKIVVFGAGFLGNKLIQFFSENHKVLGADINPINKIIKKIDACDANDVKNFLIQEKPNIVIDTVALSSYFTCEQNPKLCQKLNYETAVNIAKGCKEIDAKMVFISSSYVFNGELGNYSEKDRPNSEYEYAKSKIQAENIVLELENSIVIRSESLYGYDNVRNQLTVGTNTFENDAKVGYPDLLRCPVFVDDLPRVISILIEKNQNGLFHVASKQKITWLYFLKKVASLISASDRVKIVDNSDWILKPPHDSSLNISKISSIGIKMTSFEDGLKNLKKIIVKNKTEH